MKNFMFVLGIGLVVMSIFIATELMPAGEAVTALLALIIGVSVLWTLVFLSHHKKLMELVDEAHEAGRIEGEHIAKGLLSRCDEE